MLRQLIAYIRSLHLYFGLLISPFILIFSVSVLVLNHPKFFSELRPSSEEGTIQVKLERSVPQGSDSLAAKWILQALKLRGEIDWISKTDSTISFPVRKPGATRFIKVNTRTGSAEIKLLDEGFIKGVNYLHTMPGPHNARMRGNSQHMHLWRLATDTFVYLILFVSATGVFLWYFLRPERTLGVIFFSLGMVFLLGFLILII